MLINLIRRNSVSVSLSFLRVIFFISGLFLFVTNADAKTLKIGALPTRPPYVFSETNEGIEKMTSMETIPGHLFLERADVIILELNVFNYFRKPSMAHYETSLPVTIHSIFPETPYKIAFINKDSRDDFNKGLKIIHENGLYEKIFKKYMNN